MTISATPKFPVTTLARELATRLEARGVAFAHWKSNIHLAKGLGGKTDIDMLVRRSDKNVCEEVLLSLDFRRVLGQPWARYPGIEDWLGLDSETGEMLHAQVHYSLLTGIKYVKHLRLPWEDVLLNTRIVDVETGWPVTAPALEVLVLLARSWSRLLPGARLKFRLAGKASISGDLAHELQWLLQKTGKDEVLDMARRLKRDDVAALLEKRWALIKAADDHAVIEVARAIDKALADFRRMPMSRAWLDWMFMGFYRRLLARLNHWGQPFRERKAVAGGGLMVAMVGCDGSGKSSTSQALEKWLQKKLDAHSMYMGSGDGRTGFVQKARKRMERGRRKSKAKSATPAAIVAAGKPSRSILKKLWRSLDMLLVRRKLRNIRRARRLVLKGSIIVLDRYPQRQMEGINDGPRLQNGKSFAVVARREAELFRRCEELGPDLVLRLNVSPEVAAARKPDHDLAHIREKAALVASLTFADTPIVELNADQAFEKVLNDAKRAIWARL